jgi:hypothetical protein
MSDLELQADINMEHDIKLTADELRAILFVLKSTPIDMGLYGLFIKLQVQLKEIA